VTLPVLRLIAGATLVLFVGGAPLDAHDALPAISPQAPTVPGTTAPIVVVVLDDTKLISAERASLAAAGFDAIHRHLLTGRVQVGAMTSGPGGLVVDATEDVAAMLPISESVRNGHYNFRAAADETKAGVALDATIAGSLRAVTKFKDTPKVLVVIGTSAPVSDERRARLEASAAAARGTGAQIVWLDHEANGCDRSPARDWALLTTPAACAVLSDRGALDRVLDDAHRLMTP
jgi:hypothetical protein